MSKSKESISLCILISLLLIPAFAWSAGTIQLPQTGQTTSYATGDDGDIQAGAAWPSPRFADNGDGTVTDNLTGLMWTKNGNLPNGRKKTWQDVQDYIASLNNGVGLGGYHDWRLPNRKELRSLVDYSNSNPALPTGHPFINVQSSSYWSSSAYYSWSGAFYGTWSVFMWMGSIVDAAGYNYVWPVRAGQSESLGPLVISVNPNSGTYNKTLNITISGKKFTGATSVSFGTGISINSFTINSDTQITASITISSAATAGKRDVSVTTPKGTGTLTGGFTVTTIIIITTTSTTTTTTSSTTTTTGGAGTTTTTSSTTSSTTTTTTSSSTTTTIVPCGNKKPVILKLSKRRGIPGDVITITGRNFCSGGGQVLFGNMSAESLDWSNQSIMAKVPYMVAGKNGKTVKVKVKSANGKISNARPFKVLRGK